MKPRLARQILRRAKITKGKNTQQTRDQNYRGNKPGYGNQQAVLNTLLQTSKGADWRPGNAAKRVSLLSQAFTETPIVTATANIILAFVGVGGRSVGFLLDFLDDTV